MSKMFSGILKNALVVSPENDLNEVIDIKIENGIITRIVRHSELVSESHCPCDPETSSGRHWEEINLEGKIIMPGFVEMHCHLREPGLEEKETIETGVESAIAGGYTAICPMANTNPVNDNVETLNYIKTKSNKIDILPVCAVTKGLSDKELTDFETLKDAGAVAFSDDGKPIEDMNILKDALKKAAQVDALIISHAEDSSYSPYDNKSEYSAVVKELDIVKETDARYHFAHISTAEAVCLINEAKEEGWNVTCETAPHYFTLSKEDIQDNHARFKMNPPLRSDEDIQAVIDGLLDGTIDVIVTDHAPHTFEEKNMSFDKAPMGIVGFETAFSLAYDTFINKNLMTLPMLVKKMSVNPARILNLGNHGIMEIGKTANLTIFDPTVEWVVEAKNFKTKCKISPFEGKKLKGAIISTIAKGVKYDN